MVLPGRVIRYLGLAPRVSWVRAIRPCDHCGGGMCRRGKVSRNLSQNHRQRRRLRRISPGSLQATDGDGPGEVCGALEVLRGLAVLAVQQPP